jgi:hypothetical protein
MIDAVGRAFDAVDGFRTVVHDPDWPYLVGALRLLIRTFADSLPTNAGCTGLSSIKPFPETVLLQARNSVDLHVRDPAVPRFWGNCQRIVNAALATSPILRRAILDTDPKRTEKTRLEVRPDARYCLAIEHPEPPLRRPC